MFGLKFAIRGNGAISLALALMFMLSGGAAWSGHEHSENGAVKIFGKSNIVMPIMSPMRGKKVFVKKGCVTCHAVNGIGGHDAPPMDDHAKMKYVNPFDFAAKMWNHAPGMLAAQEEAFGETVTFLGHELADIIAFVHDDETQHSFTEKDITPKIRKLMNHQHGAPGGAKDHAKEIGHSHKPGTKPHKD